MKTWGIVGLGWLGNELSLEIKKNGDLFWGTHRANFDFLTEPFPKTPCDILFLNTPPLIEMTPEAFVEKIPVTLAEMLIFVSSTSVYGDNVGRITENDVPRPNSRNGKWLLEVENRLQSIFLNRLKIVRPGGLIGGKRHPIFHMAGRSGVAGGKSQVNLIHRADLINIILILSESTSASTVTNAVAPFHPNKIEYYNAWADRLNLARPVFDHGFCDSREVASLVLPSLDLKWVCPKLDFI